MMLYYMALSHKDGELPNLLIWLAEMDINCGLDFPIWTGTRPVMFWSEKVASYNAKSLMFFFSKRWDEKDKVQRTRKLSQTYARFIAVRTQNVGSCLCHIINILSTELSQSIRENLDLAVVCTDLNAFGLYLRPRSRFSHTDHLLG